MKIIDELHEALPGFQIAVHPMAGRLKDYCRIIVIEPIPIGDDSLAVSTRSWEKYLDLRESPERISESLHQFMLEIEKELTL